MSFVTKLKLKQDQKLFLIDAPEQFLAEFEAFNIETAMPSQPQILQVLFFALNKKALDKKVPYILKSLKHDGILWIAYPKKSGSIQSDLIKDEGWETIFQSDWEGVASIAIDSDWSALRFKHKSLIKTLKRSVPVEERKTEGIDYINRTVKLPPDAINMMKPFKGLEEFFYAMSFTHKKEYAAAIAEAKKPATRQRRIEKVIEMVQQLKKQREAKAKKK